MKVKVFLLFLVMSISSISQERYIEMTKIENGNTKIFEEFKRVKIKTQEDEKIIGKFVIIDAETIAIKGKEIKLHQIKKLKSRTVLAGVFGTALIGYGGTLVAVSPVVYSGRHGPDIAAGNTVLISGIIITLSGVFFNEFSHMHQTEKWEYRIVINE